MAENTKKSFVVDASYVLSFLLQEDNHVNATFEQFAQNDITLIAPELLVYEVGNGLRSAVVRKRLKQNSALLLLKSFIKLKIELVAVDAIEAFSFSIKNITSYYDASYLLLSKKHGLPLLTLDAKLRRIQNSK